MTPIHEHIYSSSTDSSFSDGRNLASATATFAAIATLDSTRARLAGMLFPSVRSLILARIKGVLAFP